MRRTKVLALATLLCLPLAATSCRENEARFQCDPEVAMARAVPRSEVIRNAVVFKRKDGGWQPESMLRYLKYADRAKHYRATGTVELFRERGGAPVASAQVDGPEIVEDRFFTDFVDPSAFEQAIDGATYVLHLPDLPAAEAQRGSVPRYLKWTPTLETEGGYSAFTVSGSRDAVWVDLNGLPVNDLTFEGLRGRNNLNLMPDRGSEGLWSYLPIEAVYWSGHPRNRLNLVILPDGYRKEELPLYREHVAKLVNDLLTNHSPYREYKDLINIIRVDTHSKESGADCDDGKNTRRENRYGSAFPMGCMNAVMGTSYNDRFIFPLNLRLVDSDSEAIFYDGVSIKDELLVLVNSPKYGGAAIKWAAMTSASGWDTAAHEMGHAWGNLGDEYVVPGDKCLFFMGAIAPNLSYRQLKTSNVKWSGWLDSTLPIPTPDEPGYLGKVGFFAGGAGGCKKLVYRPTQTCKMEDSSQDFCPVCKEHMIHRIYDRSNPIEGALARNGQGVTAQVARGPAMRTQWYVDGKLKQDTKAFEPLKSLPGGKHRVHLVVFDEAAPVRKDRCDLVFAKEGRF